eukprot:TRINITY_DN662_c0_g1_i2.p1 TRINITY_DN662_c0_g1~~TRINITY_DN662_c0_g1_i2.p1  ORF type:complete len:409 (+),score=128.07 TRINITY_DN662_c0_g1_i2:895-2121(+)
MRSLMADELGRHSSKRRKQAPDDDAVAESGTHGSNGAGQQPGRHRHRTGHASSRQPDAESTAAAAAADRNDETTTANTAEREQAAAWADADSSDDDDDDDDEVDGETESGTVLLPLLGREHPLSAPIGSNNKSGGRQWQQRGSSHRQMFKQGRFSDNEDAALDAQLQRIAVARGFEHQQALRALLGGRGNRPSADDAERLKGIWEELGEALPGRSLVAIYDHLRTRGARQFSRREHWSPSEDRLLLRLIEQHGRNWSVISNELQRLRVECRDRHRQLLRCGAVRHGSINRGRWAADELERLTRAIDGCVGSDGQLKALEWSAIAALVRTRSATQCCLKWYSQLNPSPLRPLLRPLSLWRRHDDAVLLNAVWLARPTLPHPPTQPPSQTSPTERCAAACSLSSARDASS